MKTYKDNGYMYFYDTNIQLWTIFSVDNEDRQVGDADYHPNKNTLVANYPKLKFTPYTK